MAECDGRQHFFVIPAVVQMISASVHGEIVQEVKNQ
jgi:hypothetical protein